MSVKTVKGGYGKTKWESGIDDATLETSHQDYLNDPDRDEGKVPTPTSGDPWDHIRADDRLTAARSKLSLHELQMIVKHVSDYWSGLYESAVKGRADFRTAYRNAIVSPAPTTDRVPDRTKVICPNCTHQFRAIPQDVQVALGDFVDAFESGLHIPISELLVAARAALAKENQS